MEIVCPSCSKVNESDPCSRCGCELGALFQIGRAAAVQLATAARHLRENSPAEAGEAALQAWEFHHTPEAARLGFLAGLASGDFAVALQWLQRTARVRIEPTFRRGP
jgi:hypothetical protein